MQSKKIRLFNLKMWQKGGGIFVIAFVTSFILICSKLDPETWMKVNVSKISVCVYSLIPLNLTAHLSHIGRVGGEETMVKLVAAS